MPVPGTAELQLGIAMSDPGTAELQLGIAMSDPGTAELQLGILDSAFVFDLTLVA
jgi:hypothetical protein